MKYMMIGFNDRSSQTGKDYEAGKPPEPKLMEAIAKHAEKMAKAGILVGTGGLLPLSRGARVQAVDGKLVVTDGPFIESKEVIGGYGILEAGSKEEAIQLAKQFMRLQLDVMGPSYENAFEIREMFDGTNCGPEHEAC